MQIDGATGRVVRTFNGSAGSFTREGAELTVAWEAGGTDCFRLVGTCYTHVDLLERWSSSQPRTIPATLRIAVVTGYYKESRALLERCMRSVREQTVAATHIMVADGFPQDWIDGTGVRHIRLDTSHGDYGNTPRGVGSLLAIAENYDAFCFLDADNWLEAVHLERCLEAARRNGAACDFVISRMNLRRPDETILPARTQSIEDHVDTNCFLFFAGAFHAVMNFALIPTQLSPIGDRIFYAYLRRQTLVSAVVAEQTVNYHCLWQTSYLNAGETPPADAKPNIDTDPIDQWLRQLSPRERVIVTRRTGLVFP